MANTILLKRNETNADVPAIGDLAIGEPVINAVSGKFYIKDTDDVVVDINANMIDITVADVGAGLQYMYDGVRPAGLRLHRGDTYIFKQSDASNNTHPLYISTTEANTYSNAATRYTDGVDTSQTDVLVWKIPFDVPDLLYIACQGTAPAQAGMGIAVSFGTQFIQALQFTTHDGSSDPLGLDFAVLPTHGVYTNVQIDDKFLTARNVIGADTGADSTTALGSTVTFAGTTDEVETSVNGQTVTIGLPDDVKVAGDLEVGGDLTVTGAFETVASQSLLIGDKEIVASSQPDSVIAGLANEAAWLDKIDGAGLSLGTIEANSQQHLGGLPTDHNFLFRKTNSVWSTSENDALRAGSGVLYLGMTGNKISASSNEVLLDGGITTLDGGNAGVDLDNMTISGGDI